MTAWFVTGTDTGVGKTLVAAALLHRLRERHARVAGMKPVAAGAPDDVAALRAASSIDAPMALVNPYLLSAPVSPHIAAYRDGVTVSLDTIVAAFHRLRENADAVVVEGAGGFRVPLGDSLDGADLAVALRLPIVLVVGMKLGCLNHALLTAESIAARGLLLAGWVANHIDPHMREVEANIALLSQRLPAPLLGELPFHAPPDACAMAARLRLPQSVLQ